MTQKNIKVDNLQNPITSELLGRVLGSPSANSASFNTTAEIIGTQSYGEVELLSPLVPNDSLLFEVPATLGVLGSKVIVVEQGNLPNVVGPFHIDIVIQGILVRQVSSNVLLTDVALYIEEGSNLENTAERVATIMTAWAQNDPSLPGYDGNGTYVDRASTTGHYRLNKLFGNKMELRPTQATGPTSLLFKVSSNTQNITTYMSSSGFGGTSSVGGTFTGTLNNGVIPQAKRDCRMFFGGKQTGALGFEHGSVLMKLVDKDGNTAKEIRYSTSNEIPFYGVVLRVQQDVDVSGDAESNSVTLTNSPRIVWDVAPDKFSYGEIQLEVSGNLGNIPIRLEGRLGTTTQINQDRHFLSSSLFYVNEVNGQGLLKIVVPFSVSNV